MKMPAYTRDTHINLSFGDNKIHTVKKDEWIQTRSFDLEKYKSLNRYLEWGLHYVPDQFKQGKYMAQVCQKNNCKKILCLGSGDGYIEYNIKKSNPKVSLVITDFDDKLISNLTPVLSPYAKLDVVDIKNDLFEKFRGIDTVFMAGTFYIFSDSEAVDFFKRLSAIRPQHIFIVAVAFLWPDDIAKYIVSHYLGGSFFGKLKNKILGKPQFMKPPGRFHGWTRSIGEFKKLLKQEGTFRIQEVTRWKNEIHDQAIIHIVPKVL